MTKEQARGGRFAFRTFDLSWNGERGRRWFATRSFPCVASSTTTLSSHKPGLRLTTCVVHLCYKITSFLGGGGWICPNPHHKVTTPSNYLDRTLQFDEHRSMRRCNLTHITSDSFRVRGRGCIIFSLDPRQFSSGSIFSGGDSKDRTPRKRRHCTVFLHGKTSAESIQPWTRHR